MGAQAQSRAHQPHDRRQGISLARAAGNRARDLSDAKRSPPSERRTDFRRVRHGALRRRGEPLRATARDRPRHRAEAALAKTDGRRIVRRDDAGVVVLAGCSAPCTPGPISFARPKEWGLSFGHVKESHFPWVSHQELNLLHRQSPEGQSVKTQNKPPPPRNEYSSQKT